MTVSSIVTYKVKVIIINSNRLYNYLLLAVVSTNNDIIVKSCLCLQLIEMMEEEISFWKSEYMITS